MRDEVYWTSLLDKMRSHMLVEDMKKHSVEIKALNKKIKAILKRLNKKR